MSPSLSMLCLLLLLLVSPSLALVKRSAIDNEREPERLWPTDRPIFYNFSVNFTCGYNREYINQILQTIQLKTCLRFQNASKKASINTVEGHDDPVLLFVNSTVEYYEATLSETMATVGKHPNAKMHSIFLPNSTCSKQQFRNRVYPIHILHALGFYFTHNREDRDDYVLYYADRTDPLWGFAYEKLTAGESKTYGVPYDYSSMTHFPPG
uniref:Metalloendopeptidase n=1 Tax=Steinernema glaseri TaxID=37863 RepID=A0A1I7YTG0_9BILA